MLTRRAATLPLLLAPLLLVGCLDYAEELTLNPDGSGRLRVQFTVDLSFLEEVSRALGDEPDPEQLSGPTKDDLTEGLQVDGLEVEEVDVQEEAGTKRSRVRLSLKFRDLDVLRQIEGFGDDRRMEFFDAGDGQVLVVYSVDTTDALPAEEIAGDQPADDPVSKKLAVVVRKARQQLRVRARLVLPGPIQNSNGLPDPQNPNASLWRVDAEHDAERHAALGKGKLTLKVRVKREALPFVKELLPMPLREEGEEGEGEGEEEGSGPAPSPTPGEGAGPPPRGRGASPAPRGAAPGTRSSWGPCP